MSNLKSKNINDISFNMAYIEKIKESVTHPTLVPIALGTEEQEREYEEALKNAKVIDEVVSMKELHILKMFKVIQELENKLINGRMKDKEKEQLRLEYYKTYINACNSFNTLTKDKPLYYNKDKLLEFLKE